MNRVIIGSRGSDLALWQANFVKYALENLNCSVEIKIIKTQGDKIQHLSFDKLEGKGFFTKEIEEALMNKTIDLAVHSHKDLETTPPEGLIIACVSERANPSDILLINKNALDNEQAWGLKPNAIVGTSSARRKSQMIKKRPDVQIQDLRGNVPTRINKLREGQYDAILLAKAGVDRLELDLTEFHEVILDPTEFVPAPAQGVLGIQIREGDTDMYDLLQKINFPEVKKRIDLERKILNLMDGGCQLPLGVYCDEDNRLYVSFATSAESAAISMEYEVTDFDKLPNQVVQDIKNTVVV